MEIYEDVYMVQPVSFVKTGNEHLVCKLKKSIYGLKQALRQWYLKFDMIVTANCFRENIVDQCTCIRVSRNSFIFLVL